MIPALIGFVAQLKAGPAELDYCRCNARRFLSKSDSAGLGHYSVTEFETLLGIRINNVISERNANPS